MRRVIQTIIFLFIMFLGFQTVKFAFNTFPSDLTLGQQSLLQMFLLFVIAILALVLTKVLSKNITK